MRSSAATTSAGRPPSSAESSSAAIRNGRSEDDTKARCGDRGGLAREALDLVVLVGSCQERSQHAQRPDAEVRRTSRIDAARAPALDGLRLLG